MCPTPIPTPRWSISPTPWRSTAWSRTPSTRSARQDADQRGVFLEAAASAIPHDVFVEGPEGILLVDVEVGSGFDNSNEAIVVNGPFFGDDLVKIYAQSDCYVMPSYREGFPNSVLEAGAMGLPQIVTDINGSREIIMNEVNGLIVPSKDTEALYEAMERMITDENLRLTIKSHAREMIANRFERGFVQQCQLDYYDELLGSE